MGNGEVGRHECFYTAQTDSTSISRDSSMLLWTELETGQRMGQTQSHADSQLTNIGVSTQQVRERDR